MKDTKRNERIDNSKKYKKGPENKINFIKRQEIKKM